MRERGQAVLFSSHVLTEVEAVCDRVAVLRRGQLVHLQAVSELLERRTVRGRFPRTPVWPDLAGLRSPRPTGRDSWAFDYHGPLPVLLEWLASQGVAEVAIESSGLTSIYQTYHGVDHDAAARTETAA
jgi:ABC-2 type transport system ATP-binding protein